MAREPWGTFKFLVIFLMILNTFFIGAMWFKFSVSCESGTFCPLKGKKDGKICPLTGKVYDGKGSGSGQ